MHLDAVYLWSQWNWLQSLSHISLWLPWFIGALSVLRQGHCKRDHINLQWNPLLVLDESRSSFKSILLYVDLPLWLWIQWPLQTGFYSPSRFIIAPPVSHVQYMQKQLLHRTLTCLNNMQIKNCIHRAKEGGVEKCNYTEETRSAAFLESSCRWVSGWIRMILKIHLQG